MRILIADDDRSNRRLLETALKRRNYTDIVCVEDGNQAWQIIQSETRPNIVLIDWMMPGMSGLELCKKIRAEKTSNYIYVILITGKSEYRDYMDGIGAGADEYITKPFISEELYVRILSGVRVVNSYTELAALNASLELAKNRLENNIVERTHDLAQNLVQVKTEYFSNMIEEVSSPLNDLLSMINHLSTSALSNHQREEVQNIKECATKLKSLILDEKTNQEVKTIEQIAN